MSDLMVRSGQLLYRRISSGEDRGREDFQLTRNRNGSRTLRSLARTDDSRFVRDVTYTVDGDGRPQEAFVRLQVSERWIGSGYFRTHGDVLHLTAESAGRGSTETSVTVPPRFHIMTHAVMLDGWTFWAFDPEEEGEQSLLIYNTSTRWDGTDGPVGGLQYLAAKKLGKEQVQVPAGTFQTTRYRLHSEDIGSPPCDLWVEDEDLLLVQYRWDEFDLEYVLGSLELSMC